MADEIKATLPWDYWNYDEAMAFYNQQQKQIERLGVDVEREHELNQVLVAELLECRKREARLREALEVVEWKRIPQRS